MSLTTNNSFLSIPAGIGEALRITRVSKHVSMQVLSELSGVSKSTISSIETGRNKNPTTRTLQELAVALGVSLQFLYDKALHTAPVRPYNGMVSDSIQTTGGENASHKPEAFKELSFSDPTLFNLFCELLGFAANQRSDLIMHIKATLYDMNQ